MIYACCAVLVIEWCTLDSALPGYPTILWLKQYEIGGRLGLLSNNHSYYRWYIITTILNFACFQLWVDTLTHYDHIISVRSVNYAYTWLKVSNKDTNNENIVSET